MFKKHICVNQALTRSKLLLHNGLLSTLKPLIKSNKSQVKWTWQYFSKSLSCEEESLLKEGNLGLGLKSKDHSGVENLK